MRENLAGVKPELVQFAVGSGAGYVTTWLCLPDNLYLVKSLLADHTKLKLMHNAVVDIWILHNTGLVPARKLYESSLCTLSMARKLMPERTDYSLKGIAQECLGIELGTFDQFKSKKVNELVSERNAAFI
jgi:ribonuclease D